MGGVGCSPRVNSIRRVIMVLRKVCVLLTLLLVAFPAFAKDTLPPANSELALSPQVANDGDWQVNIPTSNKGYSSEYSKIEPLKEGDGLKAWVRKDSYDWWTWNVQSAAERTRYNWEFRVFIERLDKGGSGLMFGNMNKSIGKFLAVYLCDDKLTVHDFDSARGRTRQSKILHEVMLKPEHQQPGEITLQVSLNRGARTIRCSVGDTEYMNLDVSNMVKELPSVASYGFFIGSFQAKRDSNAIFRKIETRRSK
jgi:hypothetical protein